MEHEFDKVMDALLRSSPKDRGVLVGDDPKVHLDAADIAAFVENALPDKARLRFTTHFADCGNCRTVLANFILLNAEADAEPAPASVPAPTAATAEPWYKGLFQTPQLAMAMGALVIVFAGFLGYTVLQNSVGMGDTASSNSAAPLTTEGRGPMSIEDNAEYSSNVAANASSMANSNAMVARAANSSANTAIPTRLTDNAFGASNSASSREFSADEEAKLAESSPPPPPPAAATTERDDAGLLARDRTQLPAQKPGIVIQQQSPDEPVAGIPAQTQTGPSRRSAQGDNRVYDAQRSKRLEAPPSRRIVGGKTFDRRDDVWYDTEYRQQVTINLRRNTDEHRRLDQGLRSITDQLPGTVVIVWKAKAYRIQ